MNRSLQLKYVFESIVLKDKKVSVELFSSKSKSHKVCLPSGRLVSGLFWMWSSMKIPPFLYDNVLTFWLSDSPYKSLGNAVNRAQIEGLN